LQVVIVLICGKPGFSNKVAKYFDICTNLKEVGLNISVEKTKTMIQRRRTRRISEILTEIVTLGSLGVLNTWNCNR